MATLVHELDLPSLNLMEAEDRAERAALLDDVRQASWLARGPLGYVVTRYEDVVGVLRDRRFHQAASRLAELSGVTDPEFLSRRRVSILTAEGDDHARLRRLVAPAFTPKAADRLRPFMREVVGELVDPIVAAGRMRVVGDVCEPYPSRSSASSSAPRRRTGSCSAPGRPTCCGSSTSTSRGPPRHHAGPGRGRRLRRPAHRGRRREPRDDLLTALIQAEEAGAGSAPRSCRHVRGGADRRHRHHPQPTRPVTLALFLEHPDSGACSANGRSWRPSRGGVHALPRRHPGARRASLEDVEYRGVVFPAGTLVSTSFVGANNDVGLRRSTRVRHHAGGAAPQLTFGSGIHYCLGAWLARAELQEALTILTRRLPAPHRSTARSCGSPTRSAIWGPARLPLRLG